MLVPVVVTLMLTAFFPVAFTVYLSLTRSIDASYLNRSFSGLGKYGELLQDAQFWNALGVEAFFVAGSLVVELALGILAALALNRDSKFMRGARGLLLSPVVLPTIVVALLFNYLLQSDSGAMSYFLRLAGIDQAWLSNGKTALLVLIAIDAWQYTPFVAVLLLAGLQTIPPDLTEAARVDGANALQRFGHIVLPLVLPILATVGLLRLIDAVQVFPTIYVLTGGGPGTSTNALNFWGFTVFFQNQDVQYGATIAAVISAITLTVTLGAARLAFVQTRDRSQG